MAWTYASLRTALQNWSENSDSEYVAELDTIIMLAEDRIYHDLDADEFRRYATSTVTTDSPFVQKPVDLVVTRWCNIKVNDNTTFLIQKDPSYIGMFWPEINATGVPRFYADWDNDSLILAPTPDDDYVIELAYTHRPLGLSSSNTTTWLSQRTPALLWQAARLEAAIFQMEDEQTIQRLEMQYQQALSRTRGEQHYRQRRDEMRSGEIRNA